MRLNIFRNNMSNNNQISEEDVNESKYRTGSSKFRELSANGSISELINYVYLDKNPYIDCVPSKSRLARNALSFFCSNNHKEAIEKFFESPFIKDISSEDFHNAIQSVVYEDKIELFNIIKQKYSIPFTEEEDKRLLSLASKYNAINIIIALLPKDKSHLTQGEKLSYFLGMLSNENTEKTLLTFKQLELHFPDLLYHQQDDKLMREVVTNKQAEIITYLLFDKKLRLTKHINILAYGNMELATLMSKRKLFDSLEQKSKNHLEKSRNSMPESIQESIRKPQKRLKI